MLAVIGCAALVSCVPIPYPHVTSEGYEPGSRENLPERVPDFIVPGQTTRDDVRNMLGWPDGAAPDQSLYSYGTVWREKATTRGYVVVGILPPSDRHTIKVRVRRLLVRFDTAGRVASAEMQQKECVRKYASDPRKWEFIKITARDCLDVSGADAIRAGAVPDEGDLVAFEDVVWIHGVAANGEFPVEVPIEPNASLTVSERSLRFLATGASDLTVLPFSEIARTEFVGRRVWASEKGLYCDHVVIARRDGSYDYLAAATRKAFACSDGKQTRALGALLESRLSATKSD